MLILTRRKDESIIIIDSHRIKVKIIDSGFNKVRVGIEAPECVSIHREEIQLKIDACNEAPHE